MITFQVIFCGCFRLYILIINVLRKKVPQKDKLSIEKDVGIHL
jgi:hypothetical protein